MSLEDYIKEMETRTTNEDLWSQLQQKENDLVLAAELGKALLDQNEELKRQHANALEEITTKLEQVEQERHLMKRKLISVESECESRVLELQNDLNALAKQLTIKEANLKQLEKDKGILVAELSSQNARLTSQLKESGATELRLQQDIQRLKEQNAVRKTDLQQHIDSVDGLRDELELVMEKKQELERRLHATESDRDNLASTLEEASDRLLFLERHVRDQDLKYQQSIKELTLVDERLSIDRLNAEPRSLLSEMDVSEPTLSQECMSIYRQLRSLCQQLKTHNDDDSGLHSDCSTTSLDESQAHFSVGLLSEVGQELVGLVLDTDVVRLLERLEQARREIQDRDVELARRNDVIMELTTKVSVYEVELRQTVEERDRARGDISNAEQDEVVAKARQVRDQAVARRNKTEVELARTRVDLMQANSQLLEIIQQKVELSQQLEQWQMDMQELLDEQLKNKLTKQEVKRNVDTTPTVPPRRRLLRFFQR